MIEDAKLERNGKQTLVSFASQIRLAESWGFATESLTLERTGRKHDLSVGFGTQKIVIQEELHRGIPRHSLVKSFR